MSRDENSRDTCQDAPFGIGKMTLSQDLQEINEILNAISIQSSRSNRTTHRSIYQLLNNHLSLSSGSYAIPFLNPQSSELKLTLTRQLAKISSVLTKEPRVVNEYRRLNRIYREQYDDDPSKSIQECHMYIAILNHIISSVSSILIDNRFKNHLYGYRTSQLISNIDDSSILPSIDKPLPFTFLTSSSDSLEDLDYFIPIQPIAITNLSCIFEVVLMSEVGDEMMIWSEKPKTMVVKISRESCLQNEISIYERLIDTNMNLPLIILGFNFLGDPVLVMEPLTPVQPTSQNLNEIFRSVLDQLKILHEIGVHCDIKPDNIMYSTRTKRYHLIDFGGTVPESSRRFTYTRAFACQRSSSKRPSKKADLIELMYTMNSMYASVKKLSRDEIHHSFSDRYSRIWKFIGDLDDITPAIYDRIGSMLR